MAIQPSRVPPTTTPAARLTLPVKSPTITPAKMAVMPVGIQPRRTRSWTPPASTGVDRSAGLRYVIAEDGPGSSVATGWNRRQIRRIASVAAGTTRKRETAAIALESACMGRTASQHPSRSGGSALQGDRMPNDIGPPIPKPNIAIMAPRNPRRHVAAASTSRPRIAGAQDDLSTNGKSACASGP